MNLASLQHSVFLQALGSAILNSLWQGFILWLIFETVVISYKNASSKFKNSFSTVLLFLSFIWFCITFISAFFNKETTVSNNPLSTDVTVTPSIHAFSGFEKFISYIISALPYLSIAYIFLLFFLTAKLLSAYRHVYIISKKYLAKASFDLQFFASNVAEQMGITKKICVWISQHIDVPATIGFIKPVILIPFASINNLSGHQLEAIILHELSHIQRNDYLINLIVSSIETILFFNPFATLLSKVIKRERENCCDDFVLQYQYDPHAYASALLRLEQSRVHNLKLAMGAVSGKKQLLSRIKRITNNQSVTKQFNYGQKLLALVLVTGIICSVAWLSPQQKKSAEIKIVKKEIVISSGNSKIKAIDKSSISNKIKQDEDLQAKVLKSIIIKGRQSILPDITSAPFSQQNFFDIKDKKEDNDDLLAEDNIDDFTESNNLNPSQFSISTNNIQLPPSINIKNFPFQKMDFNIDLSNINTKELNENLKKAYKEIKSLDWDKLQSEINKSFSQVNMINLSNEQQIAQSSLEKSQIICQLKDAEEQYQNKYFNKNIENRFGLLDSLISSETLKRNAQVQQKLKKLQQQYAETLKNNFNLDYKTNGEYQIKNERVQPIKPSVNTKIEQKNIKILIKRIPQLATILNGKKSFQFSFNTSSKESGDQNINIELDSK